MRVLVACEVSARVRDAFRDRGHNAYSVDILPTEGDPRWHFRSDALEIMNRYEWDLMVAFPPCTHLSGVGARYWPEKQLDGRQADAVTFFMAIVNATHIPRRAVENPAGIMTRLYRAPDQYVQPWWFGEPWRKLTGLWLTGLPRLVATTPVEPTGYWVDGGQSSGRGRGSREGAYHPDRALRQQRRSWTFRGISLEPWPTSGAGPRA